jgi:hypothetical protein
METSGHKVYKFMLEEKSSQPELQFKEAEFQVSWLIQYYEHKTRFKISIEANEIEPLNEEKSLFVTN